MPANYLTLDIRTLPAWRKWLQKNHATNPGLWLVRHKSHTGVECLDYEEAVREALCFGWIDSLVKRLDDDRFAVKFTPRKPESKWSAINRKRWKELEAEGRLTAAGRALAPTHNTYAPKPKIPILPGYIEKAFKANAKAWSFFQGLTPTYRRHFVVWIHIAKRPETREKRLRESIDLLAAGRKLGLK